MGTECLLTSRLFTPLIAWLMGSCGHCFCLASQESLVPQIAIPRKDPNLNCEAQKK